MKNTPLQGEAAMHTISALPEYLAALKRSRRRLALTPSLAASGSASGLPAQDPKWQPAEVPQVLCRRDAVSTRRSPRSMPQMHDPQPMPCCFRSENLPIQQSPRTRLRLDKPEPNRAEPMLVSCPPIALRAGSPPADGCRRLRVAPGSRPQRYRQEPVLARAASARALACIDGRFTPGSRGSGTPIPCGYRVPSPADIQRRLRRDGSATRERCHENYVLGRRWDAGSQRP